MEFRGKGKAAKKEYPVGPYSVRLIFSDGSRLFVEENIDDNSAIELYNEYIASLGARVGTTKRVELVFEGGEEPVSGWSWRYPGMEALTGDGS